MTELKAHDLVGLQEIAALAEVSASAVSNWRSRSADFPKPIAILASGPVFHAEQVGAWLSNREKRADRGEQSPSCFVIGPIGNELAPVGDPERERWERAIETWEKVIEPACIGSGVAPTRADMIDRTGEIPEQVFKQLRDADLVIADVTDGNPNVMYELGLRHTLPKGIIHVGEYGKLPFDVAAIRTLMFVRTSSGMVEGRKKLQVMIAEFMRGGCDPVTATRIWNGGQAGVRPTLHAEECSSGDSEELGPLELLSNMETAIPELSSLSDRAATAIRRLTECAEIATSDSHKSDSSSGGFSGRLRIANRLATELAPIADELEEIASGYEKTISSIDSGMTCLLGLLEQDPAQLSEMGQFPDQVKALVSTIRLANKSQVEFADKIVSAGKFSRPLLASARRVAEATRRSALALERSEVWNERLQALIAGQEGRENSPK